MAVDLPPAIPALTKREKEEAGQRSSVKANVVHEAVRLDGNTELRRSGPALAISGLAAGLSMGFSFIAEGLLRRYLPDAPWRPLISKFGYSFGFLIVIIGRQQLFTENTLTAVLPVLTQRTSKSLLQMLRLWNHRSYREPDGCPHRRVGDWQHERIPAGGPKRVRSDCP